ncbi:MAG: UDP-N-acetylglucosamine--N-acetylmuramyl-(pentapeptide) pyrophosphoryl-undecaprenol N-acetylglucosamine transferase [Paludibacteraceae bacterium]|nr:UDP-N-acetylglucosamine--N-acetylmuramyl-(pentapeptide) pyrophosphoryl-undecaprenol N-acetylglucosamine transferase [Paludibacteraceae bacterium]
MKYLISGGGTGGHIFPAVSIANALRELDPQADILFVGALGRMEMERVPQAGYKIIGLPVRGFNRKQPWKNISVVWDLLRSMVQARRIVREFRPDVGIGVGGYASGAAMKVAAKMGVPILLQEQNGFAGVTNKLLKNDAQKICVAYEGMERFFPAEKILLTGNPVRQDLVHGSKEQAIAYLQKEYGVAFSLERPTLLIIGGSLGARTINQALLAGVQQLLDQDIQVIWQTGKTYYEQIILQLQDNHTRSEAKLPTQSSKHGAERSSQHEVINTEQSVVVTPFLTNMPDLYALADLVISRAGASSISELCLLGKPAILVPSPNVAEDHQTHNAMALVKKDAAVLVKDADAQQQLIPTALALLQAPARLSALSEHILTLAQPDSARRIAEEVIRMVR